MTNFNLPLSIGTIVDDLNDNFLREELDYDINKLREENIILEKDLNNEQCYIYEQII